MFIEKEMAPEHKGSDTKGIALRIGYLISALAYAALSWIALRLAAGSAGVSGTQGQGWVARLFALPLGRWVVGIAGVVVIGGGLYQLYKAYSVDFSKHFRWNEMSTTERTWGVLSKG